MPERARRHRRHRMKSECEVWRGDALVGDRVLDVSPTGLRVRALDRPVAIGDRVELSLRVPGTETWVELTGEVVRRIEGRRAGDDGRSFAVALRGAPSLVRRLLASVAGWYPEASGGRGRWRDPDAAAARRAG
ncbi:MAG: PilZ domain-containing protein [Sandaracinaceae bacterium]|nr:PilZ domain-containing protein [Sandaracinaceae bacterium]